jgi:hypothetical protein
MVHLATKRINKAKVWTSDEDERLRKLVISNAPGLRHRRRPRANSVGGEGARPGPKDLARQLAVWDEGEGEVAALTRKWTPEEDNSADASRSWQNNRIYSRRAKTFRAGREAPCLHTPNITRTRNAEAEGEGEMTCSPR